MASPLPLKSGIAERNRLNGMEVNDDQIAVHHKDHLHDSHRDYLFAVSSYF